MKLLKLGVLMLGIFMSGCSTAPPQYKTSAQEDGMPIHGNFCGKNVPTITETNKELHIRILESIDAIDELDKACKQHDVCYTKNGYYNSDCDKQLSIHVYALAKQFSDPSCSQLAVIIGGYFRTSNMSFTRDTWSDEKSDVVTKVGLTPLSILIDVIIGTMTSAMLVVNTASTAFVDTVEIASPFPVTRDKRIQYPIPPRYKRCE